MAHDRRRSSSKAAPNDRRIFVAFGEETHQRSQHIIAWINALLPPDIDRGFALSQYDGSSTEDAGALSLANVADDLRTPPFLAPRRVVVIRDADKFITTHREGLERLLPQIPPTAALLLDCRSFPKSTRLYRAAEQVGVELAECRPLYESQAAPFARECARAHGKDFERNAPERLVALVGVERGAIASEVEKLACFVGERRMITADDIATLVGVSREEKVFSALDAAAAGRTAEALTIWRDTLATDRDAIYKAVGGIAFKLRQWLKFQQALASGADLESAARQARIFRATPHDLRRVSRGLPPRQLALLLSELAQLDAEVKVSLRTIEAGVETLLVRIAANAAH